MWCDQFGCYPMDQGQQQPPGQAVEFQLQAMSGDVRQFRPFRLDAGQWLDFTDDAVARPADRDQQARRPSSSRPYQLPAEMRIDGATANMTPRIIGVVDDAGWSPTCLRAGRRAHQLDAAGHGRLSDPWAGAWRC